MRTPGRRSEEKRYVPEVRVPERTQVEPRRELDKVGDLLTLGGVCYRIIRSELIKTYRGTEYVMVVVE